MQQPKFFEIRERGKRYSSETSRMIGSDTNPEESGSNPDSRYLYRTQKGAYFMLTVRMSGGDELKPLETNEAVDLYRKELYRQAAPFEEAFPGYQFEDA